MRGRFAPSPTGALHLGNLRTALVAWLMARRVGGEFVVRMEDLDRVTSSPQHEADQTRLAAQHRHRLGWRSWCASRSVSRSTERRSTACALAVSCTSASARGARSAKRPRHRRARPRGPLSGYLPQPDRRPAARRIVDAGRRAGAAAAHRRPNRVVRRPFCGRQDGRVDDVVLQRNDGVPAYNLAVVVDDAAQGVTEVVRGDDLLATTPRQIMLHRLLELPVPTLRPCAAGARTRRDASGQASRCGHARRPRRSRIARPAMSVGDWPPAWASTPVGDRCWPETCSIASIRALPRTPWLLTSDDL